MKPQDRIQIGVVGKPHGIRGGFYLDGCIDAPALQAGLALTIGEEAFLLDSRGGTDKRPIISLESVGDRNAAEALRGQGVFAARADLSPLSEGEWFAEDLVGLLVVDREGSELGRVLRLANLPSVDVLEVKGSEGEQLMIPMLRDAIIRIEPGESVVVDSEFLNLG